MYRNFFGGRSAFYQLFATPTHHVVGVDTNVGFDVEIRQAHFTKIDADVDDGDLVIETSLHDKGEYSLSAEDGSVALKITSGGGEFDIRHDDARVVTEGNFKSIQKDEDHTRISLAGGSAKINIRLDDGSVRLSAN